MAVTRFTLYVLDAEPLVQWLTDHGSGHVVRQQVFQCSPGWNVIVALDDMELSELFRLRWADNLLTFDNQRKRMFGRRPLRKGSGLRSMFGDTKLDIV